MGEIEISLPPESCEKSQSWCFGSQSSHRDFWILTVIPSEKFMTFFFKCKNFVVSGVKYPQIVASLTDTAFLPGSSSL